MNSRTASSVLHVKLLFPSAPHAFLCVWILSGLLLLDFVVLWGEGLAGNLLGPLLGLISGIFSSSETVFALP